MCHFSNLHFLDCTSCLMLATPTYMMSHELVHVISIKHFHCKGLETATEVFLFFDRSGLKINAAKVQVS